MRGCQAVGARLRTSGGSLCRRGQDADDSFSVYVFHPIVVTEGELRLTRVGADFSMYYRPIGDLVCQLLGTHARADLPATLQVGVMAYDFNAAPDLTVSFDEIVFD